MEAPEDFELVALISKPKGLRGEIVVRSCDDLPLRLYEGLEVWIVPPTLEGARKTCVASLQLQAKGHVATLEGVSDASASRELAGRYLLARSADLEEAPRLGPDSDDSQQSLAASLHDYVGCLVCDEVEGAIGRVLRIEDNPAHPLLVVEAGSQDVLVPFVEEFVKGRHADRLEVRLPCGLTELNRRE